MSIEAKARKNRGEHSPRTTVPAEYLNRSDYDGTITTNRRQKKQQFVENMSDRLDTADRRKLQGTTRHQMGNFELIAWMIRKHLDYVTQFSFQVMTPDTEFNKMLEKKMATYSEAENCDVAERHSLGKLHRLGETHVLLDGDSGLTKLQNGKLQAVEGARIASESVKGLKTTRKTVSEGVYYDAKTNKSLEYAICTRGSGGVLTFNQWVKARNFVFTAELDTLDARRGVSPLSSALNRAMDIYEGFDAQNVKAKMHAFFGIVFYSNSEDDGFNKFDTANADLEPTESTNPNDLEFSLDGPLKTELAPGDKVDLLESKTPHEGYISFMQLMLRICLMALDLPYSFLDSKGSSFAAYKADWTIYLKSATTKRERVQKSLNNITKWKIREWWARGEIVFPEGYSIDNLPEWKWTPTGIPWLDSAKEALGNKIALESGQKNHIEILAERGIDYRDWIDQEAKFQEYAREKQVAISYGKLTDYKTLEADLETREDELTDDDATEEIIVNNLMNEELKPGQPKLINGIKYIVTDNNQLAFYEPDA